MLATSKLLAVV